MISQLLFKISAYLRCRIINGPDKQAYLERYHLLRLPFGLQIYLHRFVNSDPGKRLHNHPWKFAFSLILSGSYLETRLGNFRSNYKLGTRLVKPGYLNCIDSKIFHRINLQPESEVWSLFIHASASRGWGFLDTSIRQFSYQDHNQKLNIESNPDWWKTAKRPKENPSMRQQMHH